MTKAKITVILALLAITNSSFVQNYCDITVDTLKILLDENLDSFVTSLESEHFLTFKDKKSIPTAIKEQLGCLTKDEFSLANPKEDYICCCTSSQKLPRRQLLFFLLEQKNLADDLPDWRVWRFDYSSLARLQGDKIIDIWTGYGFPKFKSKEEVVKHINNNRKIQLGLHGYVSL